MFDLSRALDQAARATTDHRAPLPAGPVLSRIRRRRTLRATTDTVVGVTAAGAVVAAGWQLTGDRAAPAVSGLGDDQLSPLMPVGCGDAPPVASDDAALFPEQGTGTDVGPTLSLMEPLAPVEVGYPLSVQLSFVNLPTDTSSWVEVTVVGSPGPQLLVAQGGVVVALTPPGPVEEVAVHAPGDEDPETSLVFDRQTVDLVRCDEATTALPPGDYELYGGASVRSVTSGAVTMTTVFHGPWGFSITEPPSGESRPDAGGASPNWVESTLESVPTEVPLVVDRLLGVRVADGPVWDVTVELDGRDGYVRAADALTAAGFVAVRETSETDPARWSGTFQNERFEVVLDVSNETGGGFYADYVIRPR